MSHSNLFRSALRISTVTFGAIDIFHDKLLFSTGLAQQELGYSATDLKKHSKNNFASIIHPDDLVLSKKKYQEVVVSKPGEMIEYVLRFKASNGEYHPYLIRDIVYEWDENGKPSKFLGLAQNMSEIAKIEDELAEKVNALKKIGYKNAHELRAPVANIMGLTSILGKEHFKTEYQKKIFDHLVATVDTLDNIIREINDLSE